MRQLLMVMREVFVKKRKFMLIYSSAQMFTVVFTVGYTLNSCNFLSVRCYDTSVAKYTTVYCIPYAQYIYQKALRRRCWASRYAPREHFCELSPCCMWRPSPSFVYPPNQTRPKETVCGAKTDRLVCVLLKVQI